MSRTYKLKTQYETGFDQPTDSDRIIYKTVCYKYTRWVVNGRILELGDPAEPKPQPIRWDRSDLLSLSVT
jgi:hypothetical protein